MLTKLFSFKKKTTREQEVKNTIYDHTDTHPDLDKPLNRYNLVKSGRLYFKYIANSWLSAMPTISGDDLLFELESIGVLTPVMIQYRATSGVMIGVPELFVIMKRDPTKDEVESAMVNIASRRGFTKDQLVNKMRQRRI